MRTNTCTTTLMMMAWLSGGPCAAQERPNIDLLDELQLSDKTLVIFTSDNGPITAGGQDPEFFNSAGPLRGLKFSLDEGGIRVPMIARWLGQIEAGTTSDLVSDFADMFPPAVERLRRDDRHQLLNRASERLAELEEALPFCRSSVNLAGDAGPKDLVFLFEILDVLRQFLVAR